MGFFTEVDLEPGFSPYGILAAHYGRVPNIFHAQSVLPRLIEAQTELVRAVCGNSGDLPRIARERILLAVAAAYRDSYCVALQWKVLRGLGVEETELERVVAGRHATCLSPSEAALVDFALKLSCRPDLAGSADIDSLRGQGWSDPQILELAVTTALARCMSVVATGAGATPDFEPKPIPARAPDFPARPPVATEERPGPYLALPSADSPALAYFTENFGLVPNLMAGQAGRPDLLEAQVAFIKAVLGPVDLLSRLQKEYLFIAVAAANLSTYCVAVHCQLVRGLGVPLEVSDQVAVNHCLSPIPEADKRLLDFALRLRKRPGDFGCVDVDRLRGCGFDDPQILEAVAMTGLTTFFNTLSVALGETPDFPPQRVLRPQEVHLFPSAARPTDFGEKTAPDDPDVDLVTKVQEGDADAFEELVRRHTRRVFRTLAGILGDPDEARDAAQEVFLKAYQHIGNFQGRSKFGTWLVSIATNAGVQRLRERRPWESLDETGNDDSFRPRQVQAWQDDPEQAYLKEETRRLVERQVMRLPAPYRVAVMLRDIEQLPTEEAAAALNLSVPGFKARVFRGRSMLREALTPHFIRRERRAAR